MRIGVGLSIPELSTRGGRFSPASLFTGGTVGAWYDPSDYSTLFQDSAGTTPVTAVEQPVGLMLDKSQGLVLGSELVPTPYTGIVSGLWLINPTSVTRNGSATNQATFSLTAAISTSKTYLVQFTVADLSGDTFFFRIGSGGTAYQITANGSYTYRVVGGGTANTLVFAPWAGSAGQATITNISVRELPGNHASQSTSTSRPVLRARYNLLTYSEQFDNAAWTKSAATVSANATTAPDGTTTADSLIEDNTLNSHRIQQAATTTAGAVHTLTTYVKKNTRSWVALYASGANVGRFFNVDAGTTGGTLVAAPTTSTITAVGNGWYRCEITFTATASTTYQIYLATGDGVNNYTGDGTSGIYLWGADLRTGSSAGTYQRIAAATDYATAGFLPYLALSTDDSFGTGNINFASTDKMAVVAGYTRNGNTLGMLAESSTGGFAGSFYLAVPYSGTQELGYVLNGTATAAYTTDNLNTPATEVTSIQFDIGGAAIADEIKPRVNGAIPSLTTLAAGPAGTGNFGNYPLYIGRRNNTTLPFEGRIYGLIVCGKALSASELSATESWMNSRTGAY